MKHQTNTWAAASPARYPTNAWTKAERLTEAHKEEALKFLSLRPVNTVILAGSIRDHGVVSPLNRGTFFGCRAANGELIGVAIIGKNLLFETHADEAIASLARCARSCTEVRMLFGKEDKLKTFWHHYREAVPMPQASRHRMITCSKAVNSDIEFVKELRIATRHDLEQVVAAHAEMVLAETGVDPLTADTDGFRKRCAKRVDQGRVWVWIKDGELIFKTDILSVTPQATYIEGLWVNPKHRGNRYSTRGLASLGRQLLSGSNTICGFVDADHPLSELLYRNAGFEVMDEYAKIYL